MKIVLNEKGKIVGRHESGAIVTEEMYSGFGKVLIGDVPPNIVDLSGDDPVLEISELEVASEFAKRTILARAEEELHDLSEKYPQSEVNSWPTKLREAIQVSSGSEEGVIYLKDAADARGLKLSEMAEKVIEKAKDHSSALAKVEKKRSDALAKIDKAKTIEKVMAAL